MSGISHLPGDVQEDFCDSRIRRDLFVGDWLGGLRRGGMSRNTVHRKHGMATKSKRDRRRRPAFFRGVRTYPQMHSWA